MKTRFYKNLEENLKKSVFLKYQKDPVNTLMDTKIGPEKKEYKAMEIWHNGEYILVLMERTELLGRKWQNLNISLEHYNEEEDFVPDEEDFDELYDDEDLFEDEF